MIKIRIHESDPTSYSSLALKFKTTEEAMGVLAPFIDQGFKVMIEKIAEEISRPVPQPLADNDAKEMNF